MSQELERVAIEGEVVSEAPSWETHVQLFTDLELQIGERRWAQAQIAASVVRIFGRSSMQEFAKAVDLSKTTVYDMAQIHWRWGHLEDSERPENLYWTHYVNALRAPDPQKAIDRAAEESLTTRQLKAHIKEEEEPERVERVEAQHCPSCGAPSSAWERPPVEVST
jgi:hypothetical protein